MSEININLMGGYFLLPGRFIDKLSNSGFFEQKIVE